MGFSTLETSTGDERSPVMSRPAEKVPGLARAGADTSSGPGASPGDVDVRAAHAAVSGIVGDAILGSADVSRTRERRRIARLRRLVAVGALMGGWVVMRRITGHGIFPTVHLPHWLGGALPVVLIIVMLGAVMAAPFIGAG